MKTILLFILSLFACVGVFAQQPVVAVAPFDAISGINATEANMISRAFNIRLGNTHKVILVDRDIVERIIKEHSFQAGDWSNQQKTAELGKALNANWIVRGNFERFGNNVLFTVSFYDIATFQFRGGDEVRVANADAAYDHIPKMVDNLITVIERAGSVPAVNNPARPITTAVRAYAIGDFGPAGGLVFYDKGIFSNGWRYLEAAPPETEFTSVQWGASNIDVPGTGTAIGSGKRNTEILVEHFRRAGESGRAAQLCVALNFDGFTDWFLPSKDELNLMYQNLSKKGWGSFTNLRYWSSSQGNSTKAWYQYLGDGQQYGTQDVATGKNASFSVRAIRAF